MSRATYRLAPSPDGGAARTRQAETSSLVDPRLHPLGVVIGLCLWVFGTQMALDAVVAAGMISTQLYHALIFFRVLPLAFASFLVLRHHISARARAENHIRCTTDAMPLVCALVDGDGVVRHANPEFLRKLSPSSVAQMNVPLESILGSLNLSTHDGPLLPAEGETVVDVDLECRDGVVRKSGIRISKLHCADDDLGWLATLSGDTDSQEVIADHALKSQALNSAIDAIVIAEIRTADTTIIYVNRAFEEMTGYTPQEALGRNLRFLQCQDRQQPEVRLLRDGIDKLRPVSVVLRNYRRDGTMFWNHVRLSVAYGVTGLPSHFIGVMRDVTELKLNAERLMQLAQFDAVTGLCNRSHFTSELSVLLRETHGPILVMTLSVIRVDDIVRCFGEPTGDVLLAAVAARLRALPGQALAGRMGDNAFGVAMTIADEASVDNAAESLRAALQEPFRLPEGDLIVLFSVGMVLGCRDMTATTVVHQALAALSQSRDLEAETGAMISFDATSDEALKRRVGLRRDLHNAIGSGDFALYLQPAVVLADGALVGAEALVRWRHPTFGLQSPELFLSVSEQTGQVLEIDAWALRKAASLAKCLNDKGRTPLAISVNLSSLRLQRHDLVPILKGILEEAGAAPSMLKLEIAGRILAGEYTEIIGDLERLRGLGFGIVVDDFGSGASNLLILNRLPLTEIKIDRRIIRGCEDCAYRQTLIQSFVAVGRTLGVAVIAKGVETQAQKQVLQRLGIQYAQGFLFGAPVDAATFIDLAQERSRSPAPFVRQWSGPSQAAQGA